MFLISIIILPISELATSALIKNGNNPIFILRGNIIHPSSLIAKEFSLCPDDDLMLAFLNPSTEKNQLGWTVRNILAAISYAR